MTVLAADAGYAIPLQRHGYRSVPPTLMNWESVPTNWREKQKAVFFRGSASPTPAHLVHVKNATIFGAGAVMTEDGSVIRETLRHQENIALPETEASIRVDGPVALLRKAGDANYGHWLVELVTRVQEFRRHLPNVPLRFAVFRYPTAMQQTRIRSLALAGVSEDEIVWVGHDPVVFSDLYFITSNSIHSHTHSPEGVKSLCRAARSAFPQATGPAKLYVPRPKGSKRSPINEEAIRARLLARGYVVVRPETMAFAEQVRAFRNATHVVGPIGAALTNILWCKPGTKVLALSPSEGMEFFFWDIANILGIDFSYLFGRAEGDEASIHSDFTVELDMLSRWLDTQVTRLPELSAI